MNTKNKLKKIWQLVLPLFLLCVSINTAEAFVLKANGPATAADIPANAPITWKGSAIVVNGYTATVLNLPNMPVNSYFTVVCPYNPKNDPNINVFMPSSQFPNIKIVASGKGQVNNVPGMVPSKAYWFVMQLVSPPSNFPYDSSTQILFTNSLTGQCNYFAMVLLNYSPSSNIATNALTTNSLENAMTELSKNVSEGVKEIYNELAKEKAPATAAEIEKMEQAALAKAQEEAGIEMTELSSNAIVDTTALDTTAEVTETVSVADAEIASETIDDTLFEVLDVVDIVIDAG